MSGPGLVFAINGGCTLAALGAVASLPGAEPARRPMDGTGRAGLAAGIAYLRSHRPIAWLEGILQVIAGTMVQQAIPDALRGRISALGSAGQNGLASLAAAGTAGLAAVVGPGRAVTGLAVATAGAGVLLTVLIAREPPARDVTRIMGTRGAGRAS